MPFLHMLPPWGRIRVACCFAVDFPSDVRMAGRTIPRQLQDYPDDLTRLLEKEEQEHPVGRVGFGVVQSMG